MINIYNCVIFRLSIFICPHKLPSSTSSLFTLLPLYLFTFPIFTLSRFTLLPLYLFTFPSAHSPPSVQSISLRLVNKTIHNVIKHYIKAHEKCVFEK